MVFFANYKIVKDFRFVDTDLTGKLNQKIYRPGFGGYYMASAKKEIREMKNLDILRIKREHTKNPRNVLMIPRCRHRW